MTNYEQRYVNDPGFHAQVHIGAQALLRHWATGVISQLHPDDQWKEAKLSAFTVLAAVDEAAVPEVEVTSDVIPYQGSGGEMARRSGAKNISSSELQSAFIDEARSAMGQPSKQECEVLLGKPVTITFNVDLPKVRGVLTSVIQHASSGPVYLLLDDNKDLMYPLNSIQTIKVSHKRVH